MSLTKIGSIGINTGIAFAGVTTIVTLNTSNDALSIGATVNVGSGITLGASGDIFATGVSTVTTLKVGSGVTVSSDGDVFATGVTTSTTFSGAFSGSGANITAINASNIASGTVPTARLGSGTASSSTFLRGDSTFQTVNTDLVSDTTPQLGGNLDVNTKNIVFGDSSGATDDRLTFGAGTDLSIYHDGSHSYIKDSGTGDLTLIASKTVIGSSDNAEVCASFIENGAVELYHNNVKMFQTNGAGVDVFQNLYLADNVNLKIGTGADLTIYHDGSASRLHSASHPFYIRSGGQFGVFKGDGSESMIVAEPDGAVQLYHNNVKKIETAAEGVVIPSGAQNCLRIFGSNADHATSALVIGQNSTTVSQLRAYGPDTSTNGQINLRTSRSDGSSSVNLTYNGNLQFDSGYGIDFSATANSSGSMSSELLDDYEEGTFTAQFLVSGSESGISYSSRGGTYTKVGRAVTVNVMFELNDNGSTNGQVEIGGLPFTVGDTLANTSHEASGAVGYMVNFGVNVYMLSVSAGHNTTKLFLMGQVSHDTGFDHIQRNQTSSSFSMRASCTYFTA